MLPLAWWLDLDRINIDGISFIGLMVCRKVAGHVHSGKVYGIWSLSSGRKEQQEREVFQSACSISSHDL